MRGQGVMVASLAIALVGALVAAEQLRGPSPDERLRTPAVPKPFQIFKSDRRNEGRGGFDQPFGYPKWEFTDGNHGQPINGGRPQGAEEYDNGVYRVPNFFEHELIYLEGDLVLDWQPTTGEWRIFKLIRDPDNMCPGLPERPINTGIWESRKFHKLVYIGCNGMGKIFDYDHATGDYEIFEFYHKAEMGEDPFRKRLTKGYRREVQNFQPLFVNEDEFMFFEGATGRFAVYYINQALPSKMDPLQPQEPLTYGTVVGLHGIQIYIGENQILDYDPEFGRWFIYQYDRGAVGNSLPFIGPLSSGMMEKGMVPTYVADDTVMLYDPKTGTFTFFDLVRPSPYDFYSRRNWSQEKKDQERFERLKLDNASQIKSGVGNYGFGNVLGTNQCAFKHSCRDCLAVSGCGWCAIDRQCYRGGTEAPCTANCSQWHPVFCEAEPCSTHKECSECLSDPFCGFCGDTQTCTEGTTVGPLFGECEMWSNTVCPTADMYGYNGPAPCVDNGLIG